jgi:hypothetical protein
MAREQERRHPAPESFKQTLARLRLHKEKEGKAKSTSEKKKRPATRVKNVFRVLHEDNHKSCIWTLQRKALLTRVFKSVTTSSATRMGQSTVDRVLVPLTGSSLYEESACSKAAES